MGNLPGRHFDVAIGTPTWIFPPENNSIIKSEPTCIRKYRDREFLISNEKKPPMGFIWRDEKSHQPTLNYLRFNKKLSRKDWIFGMHYQGWPPKFLIWMIGLTNVITYSLEMVFLFCHTSVIHTGASSWRVLWRTYAHTLTHTHRHIHTGGVATHESPYTALEPVSKLHVLRKIEKFWNSHCVVSPCFTSVYSYFECKIFRLPRSGFGTILLGLFAWKKVSPPLFFL